ncbi:MAG: hypothetical protein VW397_04600 [Candidatus Margulisiibacteriota bacterium]
MNLKKVIASKDISSTKNTVLTQPLQDILVTVIEFCSIEDILKLFSLNKELQRNTLLARYKGEYLAKNKRGEEAKKIAMKLIEKHEFFDARGIAKYLARNNQFEIHMEIYFRELINFRSYHSYESIERFNQRLDHILNESKEHFNQRNDSFLIIKKEIADIKTSALIFGENNNDEPAITSNNNAIGKSCCTIS